MSSLHDLQPTTLLPFSSCFLSSWSQLPLASLQGGRAEAVGSWHQCPSSSCPGPPPLHAAQISPEPQPGEPNCPCTSPRPCPIGTSKRSKCRHVKSKTHHCTSPASPLSVFFISENGATADPGQKPEHLILNSLLSLTAHIFLSATASSNIPDSTHFCPFHPRPSLCPSLHHASLDDTVFGSG